MLVGVAILISLSSTVVVGAYLYHLRQTQADNISDGLQRSFIETRTDWEWWKFIRPINEKNTYIRVIVTKAGARNSIFYSPRAKKFLAKGQSRKAILPNVESRPGGEYYHLTTVDSSGSGAVTNIKYDIWLSLNGITDLILKMLLFIVLITILCLGIGSWLIYVLARRLNKPLVQLTNATKEIHNNREYTYHQSLPVSESPQEVHDLSVEFNTLLDSLNNQVLADRRFVSDASHELKTPIAGIRGNVNLIKRRGKEHPEVIAPSLKFIDSESERMQLMIESLLELSRSNQNRLLRVQTNLTELVERVVSKYQTQIPQRIDISVEQNISLKINEESIEQVIISLLSNATKYSPKDSQIEIILNQLDDRILLMIKDHGTGIMDSDKPYVFQRFYRGDNTAEIEGTGLGLSIVKQLVELNDGLVRVEDNQPVGTTVVVTFSRHVSEIL